MTVFGGCLLVRQSFQVFFPIFSIIIFDEQKNGEEIYLVQSKMKLDDSSSLNLGHFFLIRFFTHSSLIYDSYVF